MRLLAKFSYPSIKINIMQNIILLSLIFSIFILTFSNCSTPTEKKSTQVTETKKEQNNLFREVMEIHDEVMPKTSDINRAKRKIKAYLEANPDLDQATRDTLRQVITELTKAEDAMMDWMQGIRNPADSVPHQKAMDYLNNEKKEIETVRDLMLKSLEKGEKTIEDQISGQPKEKR